MGKRLNIQAELLRKGATQSGVAYPKYYVWVKVMNEKTIITQGAARMAAKDGKYFDITHFVSYDDVNKNPETVDKIFPQPLTFGIKIKAKEALEPEIKHRPSKKTYLDKATG